jgi:hypothetical protein
MIGRILRGLGTPKELISFCLPQRIEIGATYAFEVDIVSF